MQTQLSSETEEVLRRFLRREMSMDDLDDWLTGAEYDDKLPDAERNVLAKARLVLIEVSEDLRPSTELYDLIEQLLSVRSNP